MGKAAFQHLCDIDSITSYVDTALIVGEIYTYKVSTIAGENESSKSDTMNIITEFPGVMNVNAIPITDVIMKINWLLPESFGTIYQIDGLVLERKSGQSGYIQLKTVSATDTTAIDSTINLSETYQYQIAAYNHINNSTKSESNANSSAFPAPTNLTATAIDDQSIKLTWQDNCSFESGYRIERDDGSGYKQVGEVTVDTEEYTDIGLTYGVNYSYRLKAYTERNESNTSDIATHKMIIPNPSNIGVRNNNDNTIKIDWIDNCVFESGFRLERNSGSGFEQIAELLSDVIEYVDTGLLNNLIYAYRVKAFTNNNESDYSPFSNGIDMTLLQPSNLEIERIDETTLELSWQDNSDWEEGYLVEWKTQDGNWNEFTSLDANTNSQQFNGLVENKVYYYRVFSTSQYGNSGYSDTTLSKGSYIALEDIDGNTYKAVRIFDQIWMAENLKVSQYQNGDEIECVIDSGPYVLI